MSIASADPTADASELRGSANGLRRERHVVHLPGHRFGRAREELLAVRWFPQALVRPLHCTDGVTVVQRIRIGPAWFDAPIRIVERVDVERRASVTAVTLGGHPERGVERYELLLDPALDRATLMIEKAWELADPLARLAGPFSTWFQGHATRRSLGRFSRGEW